MSTPLIRGWPKFSYGVVLPVAVLVLYQMALLESLSGTGSWDGILLGLGLIFIVPGMLAANCWVLAWPWAARHRLFAAGLALPFVLALVEYLWLYGGSTTRQVINGALLGSFFWPRLFGALMFLPLAVSLALAWRRSRRA